MTEDRAVAMYLDLLKRSLLNEIYLADEARIRYLRHCVEGRDVYDYAVLHDIASERPAEFAALRESRRNGWFPERDIRESGFSLTMVGRQRLDSLHECLDTVVRDGVPGDLIECGVWRGGCTIFMRGHLEAHGITDRTVWVADSFAGLPPSTHPQDQPFDLTPSRFPQLAVSLASVREGFASYGLLDERVAFLEGWFKDTLAGAPIDQLAVLRLDGDLYESTTDVLTALYDKLADGGFIIVDDYALPPCRAAVEDFFTAHADSPSWTEIDWTGVYWRKGTS